MSDQARREADIEASHDSDLVAMLIRDHKRMREAGGKLAEAALRVVRTYDGLHRLSLAVAAWSEAVVAEGDRDPHSRATLSSEGGD
jgi:hypothetical protein